MEPQPSQVAAMVVRLAQSRWPRDLTGAIPWLTSLGVQALAPERQWAHDDTEAWDDALVPSYGDGARAGWATYRGRFSDVSWWLWSGEDYAAVLAAAGQVADDIAASLGPATEAPELGRHGYGSWYWRLDAHAIEMYAHDGGIRPEGFPPGPSVVQLAISLREVADPREAEARRRAALNSRPLAG